MRTDRAAKQAVEYSAGDFNLGESLSGHRVPIGARGLLLLQLGVGLMALGLLILGIFGLTSGDFAFQWQPVARGLYGRTLFAYLSGGMLLLLGLGLMMPTYRRRAAQILAGVLSLWVLALHFPRVVGAPLDIIVWLGFCEIAAMAAGAMVLMVCLDGAGAASLAVARVGRVLFGLCLPVFGLSHFAYPDFTATMVPGFMPFPLFWAYFTGAAHVAAGIAILTGFHARVAALAFGAMVSIFVLALHVPRVMAEPANRMEWTMLAIATLLCGAAWIMAGRLSSDAPDPSDQHGPALLPRP